MARNTDHGIPRCSHTCTIAAVSMSSATTPCARSSASSSRSVVRVSVVHIRPSCSVSPMRVGRCSRPLAPSTTTSGRTSVPIAVSSSSAPVMPTTSTWSTSTASRSRSMPAVASSVPMPVTIATTSRPSSVPTMHGQTVDVGLGQLELGHQRCELHRHGAHEGQRSRGHPGSLPHGGCGRQRSTAGSAPGLVAPG